MKFSTRVRLKGNVYHHIKDSLKELLKVHDLKWRGNFYEKLFKWSNPDSVLIADFEKDPLTSETRNSFFLIDTDDAGFYSDIMNFLKGAGAEENYFTEDIVKKKLEEWIEKNKPNIEVLRNVHKAPDSFINFKVKEFEENKRKYEEALKQEYGSKTAGAGEVKL